jgi:hypothetical protein
MTLTDPKETLRIVLAPLFAGVMVCLPWRVIFYEVNGYDFVDRLIYQDYFLFQQSVLEYRSFDSYLSYVSNEFFWHYLIGWIVHNVNIPIEYIFGAISFLTFFVFGRIVLIHAGPKAILLLVNPLVVDLAFSQLRLALAVSFLGIAYLLKDRKHGILIFFVAVAPFVHAASVILIAIYVVPLFVRLVVEKYGRGQLFEFFLLVLLGAFTSVLLGPLREVVLSYIGDRRAVYVDVSSSIMYLLFWVSLLIPLGFCYRQILQYSYVRYTVVILSIIIVNLWLGGYSTRFLATAFPFIVSSIFLLSKQVRTSVLFAFVGYAMFQWLYWLRVLGG